MISRRNPSGDAAADYSGLLTSGTVIARSAIWRFLEVAGIEALSFALMTLLARLLMPEDYGIVAIAGFFVACSQTVLFWGLPQGVIQSQDLTDTHLDSVFWTNLLLGIVFSLAFLVLASPIAQLLGNPSLSWALAGLSPLPVLFAAIGVYYARLRRAMEFRSLALRSLASVIAGGLIGAALAFSGAGFWSLVGQQLAYTSTSLVVLITASRWRPRLRADRRRIRDFARFGSQVSGVALIDTLGQSGLALIVGAFLPAAQVGFFFLARRVIFSLSMFTFWSVNELAFPVLSRLRGSSDDYREGVYMTLLVTGLICVPVFAGVALTAEPLIQVLFGAHWGGNASTLRLLAFAGIFQGLPSVANQVFTSLGQPRHALRISALISLVMLALVGLVASHGIAAAALGVGLAYLAVAPLTINSLRAVVGLDLGRLVREQVPIWVAAAAMTIVVLGANGFLPTALPASGRLAVEVGLGALAFIGVAVSIAPELGCLMGALFAEVPAGLGRDRLWRRNRGDNAARRKNRRQ